MDSWLAGGSIAVGLVVLVGFLLVVSLIGFIVFRSWVKVARADEALVVSGRSQKLSDGTESAVTVIVNGKAAVNPLTQRHEVISLRSRQVNMTAEAQSYDGVTLNVEAVAIVKIGSDPMLVRKAAERFASQDDVIDVFTTEQLEGALRGVVARLEVIALMRDRKKFSEQIATDLSGELKEQGLILDSFQIKGIVDNVDYIKSLGAPEIESKREYAEIAQTNAERAIRKQKIINDEANLVEQTEYDKNTAASKSEVGKANANAEQAEKLARSQAEQGVLQKNAENQQAKLDADVKRVADAKLYEEQKSVDSDVYRRTQNATADLEIAKRDAESRRVKAEADADAIRVEGQAEAEAIKAKAEAIAQNKEALLAEKTIEQLPELMTAFAKGYEKVGGVTIVGGSSTSASESLANENSVALRGIFENIKATTGLDMAEIIQGRVVGKSIGEGMRSNDESHTDATPLPDSLTPTVDDDMS